MPAVDDDFGQRNKWLARHVLPREGALRAAIARWRLPDGVDADDIVQEVFGNLAEVDDHAAIRNVGCTLTLLHVIPEPDAQFWKGYIYEVGDMDAKARADIDRLDGGDSMQALDLASGQPDAGAEAQHDDARALKFSTIVAQSAAVVSTLRDSIEEISRVTPQ